jgi:hypothetical protein
MVFFWNMASSILITGTNGSETRHSQVKWLLIKQFWKISFEKMVQTVLERLTSRECSTNSFGRM